MFLQAGGKAEHIVLGVAAEGNDIGNLRCGKGQSSGLVKDHGVRIGDRLQEPSAFDGNVVGTAFPHGGKYGDRH